MLDECSAAFNLGHGSKGGWVNMKLRLVLGVCPKEAGRKEEGAANQLRCDRLGVLGKLGSRYIIHLQRLRQGQ